MKKLIFAAFLAVLLVAGISASWAGNGCCQQGGSCCGPNDGNTQCGTNCTCVDADKDGKCDNCDMTCCISGGECCGCCGCTTTSK